MADLSGLSQAIINRWSKQGMFQPIDIRPGYRLFSREALFALCVVGQIRHAGARSTTVKKVLAFLLACKDLDKRVRSGKELLVVTPNEEIFLGDEQARRKAMEDHMSLLVIHLPNAKAKFEKGLASVTNPRRRPRPTPIMS
jgi:DNA-binding transcriptional MerR regulator